MRKVQSLKNNAIIADKCLVAERFFDRLQGLIGRSALDTGEGMLFPRCNDIHMWFMSIPIDVVFLRRERAEPDGIVYRVVSVRENLRPWRFLPAREGRASETLELSAGTIQRCQIAVGDELCIS